MTIPEKIERLRKLARHSVIGDELTIHEHSELARLALEMADLVETQEAARC